jgi:hypothetical protein
MMLAMAIMILPCRDSLLEVLDIIIFASMTSTPTSLNALDKELFPSEETPPGATSRAHAKATIAVGNTCNTLCVNDPDSNGRK